MILTLALEDAGMTKDDLNVVPMEPSSIVAALSSKQVDGAGFWYPALATVKQQVPDLVELAENSDFEDTGLLPDGLRRRQRRRRRRAREGRPRAEGAPRGHGLPCGAPRRGDPAHRRVLRARPGAGRGRRRQRADPEPRGDRRAHRGRHRRTRGSRAWSTTSSQRASSPTPSTPPSSTRATSTCRRASNHTMKPSNILFLMTDQHRADTLGAYGNALAATPVLDELARTGTRFDRWYTPTAICTPARASLLTGQAPFRHRVLANHERNVGYLEDLADGSFTFVEALREQGYNTGLVGKWHAGTEKNGRRLRLRRPRPSRLAQPRRERGLPRLPRRARPAAVRDQRSHPRHPAERRAGQPAGCPAPPAGGGDLRALPRHPHDRAARALCGRRRARRHARSSSS